MTRYVALLDQYARQHTRTTATNDTARPAGSGHVFELVHPDLGYWIDRYRMYMEGSGNKDTITRLDPSPSPSLCGAHECRYVMSLP